MLPPLSIRPVCRQLGPLIVAPLGRSGVSRSSRHLTLVFIIIRLVAYCMFWHLLRQLVSVRCSLMLFRVLLRASSRGEEQSSLPRSWV